MREERSTERDTDRQTAVISQRALSFSPSAGLQVDPPPSRSLSPSNATGLTMHAAKHEHGIIDGAIRDRRQDAGSGSGDAAPPNKPAGQNCTQPTAPDGTPAFPCSTLDCQAEACNSAQCAFLCRNSQSRMPLVPTPARFKFKRAGVLRVANDIPLGCPLFLPVHTVNCVQTLKGQKGAANEGCLINEAGTECVMGPPVRILASSRLASISPWLGLLCGHRFAFEDAIASHSYWVQVNKHAQHLACLSGVHFLICNDLYGGVLQLLLRSNAIHTLKAQTELCDPEVNEGAYVSRSYDVRVLELC